MSLNSINGKILSKFRMAYEEKRWSVFIYAAGILILNLVARTFYRNHV